MVSEKAEEKILGTSSQFVRGVGPARQKLLSRLGIETVDDLIRHYPRAYYDRTSLVSIGSAPVGETVTVSGEVLTAHSRRLGSRRSMLTVAIDDGTGALQLVFFNQSYLDKYFRKGSRVIASGRVKLYRDRKQMVGSEWEMTGGGEDEQLLNAGRIVPVYPLTAGISQRMMRRIVKAALDRARGMIPENLPGGLLRGMGFPGREQALFQIHYPDDEPALETAVRRLKFEEVFFLHLLIREKSILVREGRKRPVIAPPHRLARRFLENLPFSLTGAQKRVLGEIRADVESEKGLSRLLQGDVGSGKTVVGLASMLLAVGAGHQAAMMAPTEILAQQHAMRMEEYLEGLGVTTALLLGSMRQAQKRDVHRRLASGEIDLVVGTHALIQESISFRQLGLAVIDEQHRFGVRQRATLGSGDLLPHFLVMTATPIPRSLAQTVYGDLDLSVIDEMPFGSRDVRTEIVLAGEAESAYATVRDGMREGRQAFILYPLVEESEGLELKAATEEFERLSAEEFSGLPIGLLHGRMSFEEKMRAISMFRAGEILGLVTTTVIEVGVDIPNASFLLINHPERFGLAQLHQLRGRIGRGGSGGVCYLLVDEDASGASARRLEMFASTTDGFRVAEIDLEMRGPGEVWGTRQSGYPAFRLINPLSDSDLVQRSWRESGDLLAGDPGLDKPENRVVADYFRQYYRGRMGLADIG
jgi:ATP-dependent DNA helicase RecG